MRVGPGAVGPRRWCCSSPRWRRSPPRSWGGSRAPPRSLLFACGRRFEMRESIRDRLAALTRRELVGLVALVAVALAGVGLWYVRSLPRPVEMARAGPAVAPAPGPTATASP